MSDAPDLTVESWKPTPKMASAIHDAMSKLATTWPKLSLALESNDAGRDFAGNYAFAMRWVDVRAIPMAAREWIATQKFAPKPSELAGVARAMTRQHFPTLTRKTQTVSRGLYDGAKAFWFVRAGRDEGFGRLNAERAIAFVLRSGDRIGISESEAGDCRAGKLEWGWLKTSDVPAFAAPAEFYA